MKRFIRCWLLIASAGSIIPQALANGGGGHGGGHGSSGGHASGGFHGSFGSHSSTTWGGIHVSPGYHGFSSKPSGNFNVGHLGGSNTTTPSGSGYQLLNHSESSSRSLSSNGSTDFSGSERKVTLAEALGPLRELDPGPVPIATQQLQADTLPAADVVPVTEPEAAVVTSSVFPGAVNNDEFWLACFGGLVLIGLGCYLRYRRWASQRQLLAQIVASTEATTPTHLSDEAIQSTTEQVSLADEAKVNSKLVKFRLKSRSRTAKK